MSQSIRVSNAEFMYLMLCMKYAHSVMVGGPDDELRKIINEAPDHVPFELYKRFDNFLESKKGNN